MRDLCYVSAAKIYSLYHNHVIEFRDFLSLKFPHHMLSLLSSQLFLVCSFNIKFQLSYGYVIFAAAPTHTPPSLSRSLQKKQAYAINYNKGIVKLLVHKRGGRYVDANTTLIDHIARLWSSSQVWAIFESFERRIMSALVLNYIRLETNPELFIPWIIHVSPQLNSHKR